MNRITGNRRTSANTLMSILLRIVAANFNRKPSLKKYLLLRDGWLDLSVGIRTETDTVRRGIVFSSGRVIVTGDIPEKTDVILILRSDRALLKLLSATPTDQIYMMLKSDLRIEGSIMYLNQFFFLISLLLSGKQIKQMEQERKKTRKGLLKQSPHKRDELSEELASRQKKRMKAPDIDPGVRYLKDPYLPEYGIGDFPRLKKFLDIHLTRKPEVCPELPLLLTRWHREHGFETDSNGKPWSPVLRKAHAYRYLMENREPIIGRDSLIAGTTTSKEIGCVVYPDGSGGLIWNELLTIPHRTHNPFDITQETRDLLHFEVFPYWTRRNFREWVRDKYGNPLCQQIDERFALYFNWKQATISHTIPDFPKILAKGTEGMKAEIRKELAKKGIDAEKRDTLKAMILCLEGLEAYSDALAKKAASDAKAEQDETRRGELQHLASVCARVVRHPARTLDEAVNSVWITWVALHMESMNAGLSLGRLDRWFQPYFEADMKKIRSKKMRDDYVRHAIELIGNFYLRCTDHFPLTPDLANFYFGGSSSDQALTLGGVTPEGKDAVNDMTYVFLKVTEMLSIRDPNVNARFMPGVNSDTYLQRLCEVNLVTAATPSMHNDRAIIGALSPLKWALRDIRNWSATGCVEPTLSGKHIGHTNMQMMNMVAALEMAMNNGRHPLTAWDLGPKTGKIEDGAFATFEQFFDAFTAQFRYIIERSIEYNHMLGEAHQYIRPTPLLSSLIDGSIKKGRDVTRGGATYNSSGTAIIGLADVTDSLLIIKKLVFEDKKITFADLKRAVDTNFMNDAPLMALVRNRVPLFGSGSDEAVAMANRIATWAHDCYGNIPHYRNGKYNTGFWSMSNHVAFGTLTGALPSGRQAGKPFTPGLTPQPFASKSLLDNIRDVARLDVRNMSNNIAFNVKVVPSSADSREKTVRDMFSYVKTYFDLGGMQMQMNVVTSDTLRDAMAHPENYRNLIVRVSGYNAYFVTLNRDMQMELIERAEYSI
ncbi:MAG TPA: pyruvate formate lyase family protein [Spirochaetota bacterium]|nr:pyruvate formate lyase family protein [Spirochaetota bacterium]HPR48363.1 pyruvate formate lyase family protein [Spirochaetota bacterium]